jgi:glycosyltransferase involved in cell wall biosynthesis
VSAPVSVIVYTKNEEQDLPGCLESLAFSDDVHVFDSCSTDRTQEVARSFGATVTERPFDTESVHRNWAMENIPFRHPWVYHSDADERATPALAQAIREAVANPRGHAAFRVRRRDYFMGRWLRHCVPSPTNIRLFLHERMRYERLINPVPVVQGTVGEIGAHFDHFPFSKGLAHWFDKHNRYSTLEARQIVENRAGRRGFSLWKALAARDYTERRYHQKEAFYRMPFRPAVKFFFLYVAKGGFLDGRAGLDYCTLMAVYERMIAMKVRELDAGG